MNSLIPTDEETPTIDNPPKGEPEAKPRKRTTPGVEVNIANKDFAEVVSTSIVKLIDELTVLQLKPTLAEYIKLLELAKQLRTEPERKEIEIRWIGPSETWSDEE